MLLMMRMRMRMRMRMMMMMMMKMQRRIFERSNYWKNKAVYTEGLVACCWAGVVTILYRRHWLLAESSLIVSIAQIVLSRQFGSFSQTAMDRRTDRQSGLKSRVHATKNGGHVKIQEKNKGGVFCHAVITSDGPKVAEIVPIVLQCPDTDKRC